MELAVYNLKGEKTATLETSAKVFEVVPKPQVLQQALVWYQAAKRRGTHSSLTKGEVQGSGRKPWRQKGTGRARVGSIRSPLWRKGGVIFGPKPKDYHYSLPKKIRRLAIGMALSDRAQEGKILVVEEWKIPQPKTKEALKILKALKVEDKALIVLEEKDKDFYRAARNIAGISVIYENDLNIHNLLNSQQVIISKEMIKRLEERLK